MPPVARDLGEDIWPSPPPPAPRFASRTSGAVIERIIATAPVAARRLADPALFSVLPALAGPRAVARAARLCGRCWTIWPTCWTVLTLGGLRRWADWGVEAHRTDYPALDRLFRA